MPDRDRVVAIGFLTERHLTVLGQAFKRFYPLEDHDGFDEMLRQIDSAEQLHTAERR